MNTFPFVLTIVTNKSMSKSIEILESCEEEFNVALQDQVEMMTEMIMYSIESLQNPKKRLKKAEQLAANVGIDVLNSIKIDYSFSMVDDEHYFPATFQVSFDIMNDEEAVINVDDEEFARIFTTIFTKIMDYVEEYVLVALYPFSERVLH